MPYQLESKSSGVFYFIRTFALKIAHYQQQACYKNDVICDVTNPTIKKMRKENTNGSHVIYVVLYIKSAS